MIQIKNSLGVHKPNSKTKVVVAMSGGVDSSVVAAMLHYEGYEVIGITLQLYSSNIQSSNTKTCCAGRDIQDAKRVSEDLGIRHYVFDYEKKFKSQVIDPFIDSYKRGETPVPCISCNQHIKFQDLLNSAKNIGADVMATGHYIRRLESKTGAKLFRAFDKTRDQSYFLFSTTYEQLKFLRFPLGEMSKKEVRSMAAEYGLLVSDKVDSQDICFVTNSYSKTIEENDRYAAIPGKIVDIEGNVLGEHKGIINYTIGQRRGLKISAVDPYYVVGIDAKKNQVIVGNLDSLMVQHIKLKNVNWLCEKTNFNSEIPVQVKLRSAQEPLDAHIINNDFSVEVKLKVPNRAIAPGQACVFYQGEHVLGGGWIEKAQ